MDKLSKRELILVIFLINLLGYYLLFNFVGLSIFKMNKSKLEAYEELKAKQEILEIENLKNEVDIKNLETLTQKNNEFKEKIFSNTNSENIHYFINNITKKSNLLLSDIKITKELENIEDEENTEETTEENNVSQENIQDEANNENIETIQKVEKNNVYNVEINLVGEYKNKLDFIKSIEAYGKTIAITDFFTTNIDENTSSKIKMNIYTMDKEQEDKEFIIK